MSPEGYIILGTLGGVLVTGVIAIINNLINEQAKEKRQKRELIIKLGFETWQTLANDPNIRGNISPPELYVAHMSRLIDVLLEDNFDEEKYKQKIQDSFKFTEEIKPLLLQESNKQTPESGQGEVSTEQPEPSKPEDFPPKVPRY